MLKHCYQCHFVFGHLKWVVLHKTWTTLSFRVATPSCTNKPACAVQALVEQCSAAGQPEQVERCVLHMDVASLDFSQVNI